MIIEESKKFLKENGYCSFNLCDFNIDLYNELKEILVYNETNNYKKVFKSLKTTIEKSVIKYIGKEATKDREPVKVDSEFETHELAEIKKNELLNLIENDDSYIGTQIWFFADTFNIINYLINTADKYDNEFLKKNAKIDKFIRLIIERIVKHFYEIDESQELHQIMEFTLYDKGCFLKNHSDGNDTGRVCACLIYLNEEYSFDYGGYLVLNNKDKILPKFGNVAIIDLEKFDIDHMVTKVTDGPGRIAILSFVKKV